jgi:uncharacterized protein (DUF2147 family)
MSRLSLIAILMIGLAAAPALAEDVASLEAAPTITPEGSWEIASGESRFRVSYCGDGAQLCAKLIWLREDARTDENVQLLNHYVVKGAVAQEHNKWVGDMRFDGKVYEGAMTLLDANSMKLVGCSGMLCQSFQLHRL